MISCRRCRRVRGGILLLFVLSERPWTQHGGVAESRDKRKRSLRLVMWRWTPLAQTSSPFASSAKKTQQKQTRKKWTTAGKKRRPWLWSPRRRRKWSRPSRFSDLCSGERVVTFSRSCQAEADRTPFLFLNTVKRLMFFFLNHSHPSPPSNCTRLFASIRPVSCSCESYILV